MMRRLSFLLLALGAACGGSKTADNAPPAPATNTPAPVLAGQTVMVFPVQRGSVPIADAAQQHYALDTDKLNAELAYWLPQLAGNAKWILPAAIQRAITRSPTLGVDMNNLAVTAFQRAQVKRIGDPLFGDLRKLAAVLDAPIAVIPVAAEFIGATEADSRAQIATAVINAMDGTVVWFGVIEGDTEARGDASIASAAQTFARKFSGKKN
jgi:hypothetical protein